MAIWNKWLDRQKKQNDAVKDTAADVEKKDGESHKHSHDEAKEKHAPKVAKVAKTTSINSQAYSVFSKPHLSEKTAHRESENVYTFIVGLNVTKHAIKQAIKDVYGVTPTSIRTMVTQGKQMRMGRMGGRRSDYKKAMVTLKKGDSINIHEGV